MSQKWQETQAKAVFGFGAWVMVAAGLTFTGQRRQDFKADKRLLGAPRIPKTVLSKPPEPLGSSVLSCALASDADSGLAVVLIGRR